MRERDCACEDEKEREIERVRNERKGIRKRRNERTEKEIQF